MGVRTRSGLTLAPLAGARAILQGGVLPGLTVGAICPALIAHVCLESRAFETFETFGAFARGFWT